MVAVASRSSSTSSSFLRRLGSLLTPLAAPLLRVTVHRPLLPLALLSGCGFTLPLPLRPCCLLAHAWQDSGSYPSPGSSFSRQFFGFSCSLSHLVVRLHVLGAFTLAVSPVPHSSLAVPIAHWRVSFLFIFISCLLISHWSLAILFMAPCPFCLRYFFDVLALPPGWSPSGFFRCSGFSFPLSFVQCVCPAMVPSSFLLPFSLATSSLGVLCPWLSFGSS